METIMNALDVFLDLPWDKQEELLRMHGHRRQIRSEAESIKRARRELDAEEAALQQRCQHPAVRKTHRRLDHYDSHATFYTDFYCPDCDKHWTLDGSL